MTLRDRLPPLDARTLGTAVLAGAFATIGFDLFGQFVSPLLKGTPGPFIGARLAPVPLADQAIAVLTGLDGGVRVRPRARSRAARPDGAAVLPAGLPAGGPPAGPRLPWPALGAAYGTALVVLALYVMAHLVAGNPAFLGWGGITLVALWGHMIFGVIVAGVVHARGEARAPEADARFLAV